MGRSQQPSVRDFSAENGGGDTGATRDKKNLFETKGQIS